MHSRAKPLTTVVAIVACLVVAPLGISAQEAGKVYRIGWLSASAINTAFRQTIRELGYVEGKNLVIEYRQARRTRDFSRLARELVTLKPDLLFTVGVSATRAAKEATSKIPIVMGNSSTDPVRQGLIDSLSNPGGNVTGVFDLLPDLAGKRVEILTEVFPKLARIAHISYDGPVGRAHLKRVQDTARERDIKVNAQIVKSADDLESAFRDVAAQGNDAAIVVGVSFFIPNRPRIIDLAARYRLPVIYTHQDWVSNGGLIAYTTDSQARYSRAAWYVDQIFKGATPAKLPVEQPRKFLLEINLRTARALGITVPASILLRADEVIE